MRVFIFAAQENYPEWTDPVQHFFFPENVIINKLSLAMWAARPRLWACFLLARPLGVTSPWAVLIQTVVTTLGHPASRASFTQIPDAAGQPQGRNLTVHPAAKTQQLPVSLKVWIWIRRRLVTCQSVCDRTVTDSRGKPCWLEVRLSLWKQFMPPVALEELCVHKLSPSEPLIQ